MQTGISDQDDVGTHCFLYTPRVRRASSHVISGTGERNVELQPECFWLEKESLFTRNENVIANYETFKTIACSQDSNDQWPEQDKEYRSFAVHLLFNKEFHNPHDIHASRTSMEYERPDASRGRLRTLSLNEGDTFIGLLKPPLWSTYLAKKR